MKPASGTRKCFVYFLLSVIKWCLVVPEFRRDDPSVCTRERLCFTVWMFPVPPYLRVIEMSSIRDWAHVAHLLIPSSQLQEFPTYLWESHPSAFTPPNPPATIIPGKHTVTIEIKSEKQKNKTTTTRGKCKRRNMQTKKNADEERALNNAENHSRKKADAMVIYLNICVNIYRKMKKEKNESVVKVSVSSLWRIVGARFACSSEWVSGVLYFWSLTALWIRGPEVPGKEPPVPTSCRRSGAQGRRENPIVIDNGGQWTRAPFSKCMVFGTIWCRLLLLPGHRPHSV